MILRRYVWEELQLILDPEKLVFLDEMGVNSAMTPEYGWSEVGRRILDFRPVRGRNVSVIGALTLQGLDAVMTYDGGVDGATFLAYLEQVLVPTLRPGQVVLMDNVGFHKVQGVERAIRQAGCDVAWLPPYSPEFNPIEECWSKLKSLLRKARPRSRQAIDDAIRDLLDEIRPRDASGWFRHAGYGTRLAQLA